MSFWRDPFVIIMIFCSLINFLIELGGGSLEKSRFPSGIRWLCFGLINVWVTKWWESSPTILMWRTKFELLMMRGIERLIVKH
ncbi:hypothetical protein CDL15_Pgr019569 [Punica granatum]|uniref:Uncharacterized protein n=1 Tax=Punica granatum TaxID=22663 RepID=A0A218X6F1_PUNGR|nr:hypothetical protein CDL15_Pgr019569 [Punica granatum]